MGREAKRKKGAGLIFPFGKFSECHITVNHGVHSLFKVLDNPPPVLNVLNDDVPVRHGVGARHGKLITQTGRLASAWELVHFYVSTFSSHLSFPAELEVTGICHCSHR